MLQRVNLKSLRSLYAIIRPESRREFIKLPTFSNKIEFRDKAVVRCRPELLYNLVADVDNYHEFVPNVFASRVLRQPGPNLIEASLSIGIPNMIQAEYTSTIHLQQYRRILIQSKPNDFAKFIKSEWMFEPYSKSRQKLQSNGYGDKSGERCLVRFAVEFELYSQIAANMMNMVLDDFTRKTMMAFVQRAERLNRLQNCDNTHLS